MPPFVVPNYLWAESENAVGLAVLVLAAKGILTLFFSAE